MDDRKGTIIYTPPPIPVGLRLFQKVRSDSGRIPVGLTGIHWNPVDSSGLQWIPVDSSGFQWIPVDSGGVQWIPVDSGIID